jgi:hypothetical protein
MDKHTPGPWAVHVNVSDTQRDSSRIDAPSGEQIAAVKVLAREDKMAGWYEAKANARLMRAAPIMLTALREAAEYARLAGNFSQRERLLTAITEATGE